MTLEMAKAILKPLLLKKSGPIDITFMGGETLLAMDVIRPLIEWTEKETWNRDFKFFGSTNGTLLNDELKDWLKKHKHIITLGLSYDGIPHTQIKNRGNNHIDLDFFIETWPNQPIQMTINADTVEYMADGVIHLLEMGATVHPNVAYEDSEWSVFNIAAYGKELNKLIYYYNENPGLPTIAQFEHNLTEYVNNLEHPKPQPRMCGAGDSFKVFDIDGNAYPCHILSPLVLVGTKLQEIQNGVVSRTTDFADPTCSCCPYITSCPTCMACNFVYRGNLWQRDKTHCQIMKMEVKAFIKKGVIRLKSKKQLSPEDATEIDLITKLAKHIRP